MRLATKINMITALERERDTHISKPHCVGRRRIAILYINPSACACIYLFGAYAQQHTHKEVAAAALINKYAREVKF